jgi:uncharacterized protein (DUF433 family)
MIKFDELIFYISLKNKKMDTHISLPQSLYNQVSRRAKEQKLTPEQYVVEFLSAQLMPEHPYVEMVRGAGETRPVIKGTRTGIDSIVGYFKVGYSPQEIADEILPHLSLAEVYDALSYYEDHHEQIEKRIAENTPEAWRGRLIQEMGEKEAKKLLGED